MASATVRQRRERLAELLGDVWAKPDAAPDAEPLPMDFDFGSESAAAGGKDGVAPLVSGRPAEVSALELWGSSQLDDLVSLLFDDALALPPSTLQLFAASSSSSSPPPPASGSSPSSSPSSSPQAAPLLGAVAQSPSSGVLAASSDAVAAEQVVRPSAQAYSSFYVDHRCAELFDFLGSDPETAAVRIALHATSAASDS